MRFRPAKALRRRPLVEALLAQGHTLVLSTTTPTGRAQLMRQFSGRAVICYGPFDCAARYQALFKSSQAKTRTNDRNRNLAQLDDRCARRERFQLPCSMPVSLSRSFRGYQKLGSMMGATLRQFSWIAVQSPVLTRTALRPSVPQADQLSVTGIDQG